MTGCGYRLPHIYGLSLTVVRSISFAVLAFTSQLVSGTTWLIFLILIWVIITVNRENSCGQCSFTSHASTVPKASVSGSETWVTSPLQKKLQSAQSRDQGLLSVDTCLFWNDVSNDVWVVRSTWNGPLHFSSKVAVGPHIFMSTQSLGWNGCTGLSKLGYRVSCR